MYDEDTGREKRGRNRKRGRKYENRDQIEKLNGDELWNSAGSQRR